jgi:hypothetical protein
MVRSRTEFVILAQRQQSRWLVAESKISTDISLLHAGQIGIFGIVQTIQASARFVKAGNDVKDQSLGHECRSQSVEEQRSGKKIRGKLGAEGDRSQVTRSTSLVVPAAIHFKSSSPISILELYSLGRDSGGTRPARR